MTRLHNEEAKEGEYDFEAVGNTENRVDGDLMALVGLYIQINADNAHSNFILTSHSSGQKLSSYVTHRGKCNSDRFLKAV